MSTYRLVVYKDGQEKNSGTAWFVRPHLVATAFHVVGRGEKWLCDETASVRYALSLGEGKLSVALQPDLADPQTDVALLRPKHTVNNAMVLPLANAVATKGALWEGRGYPDKHQGKHFMLGGDIADTQGPDPSRVLQLTVKQGTDVDWGGVSGTPVQSGGKVIGLITWETGQTNTVWATDVTAIRYLVVTSLCRDFLGEYYTVQALQQLITDLEWPGEAGGVEPIPVKPAEWMARYAAHDSQRLDTLLRRCAQDHPQQVEMVRQHVQALSEPDETSGFDWRNLCRTMLSAQLRLTTNLFTSSDGMVFTLDEVYVPVALGERSSQDRVGKDIPQLGVSQLGVSTDREMPRLLQDTEFFERVLRQGDSPRSLGTRVAIIGDPGAGKTPFLQKIAQWMLDNTEWVPIWISLADLQGQSLAAYLHEEWLQQAAVRITDAMRDVLGALCKSGRVWLLLDGVDEMAAESASLLLSMVARQLTGWVAEARIVLTCRLNVWDAGKNALEAFDAYRLEEFRSEQVRQCIDRWFARQPERGQRLWTELDQAGRERLREMVRNPLRLALLCHTWQRWQGGLPATKAALYARFVEAHYEWKQDEFPTNATQRQTLNTALGTLRCLCVWPAMSGLSWSSPGTLLIFWLSHLRRVGRLTPSQPVRKSSTPLLGRVGQSLQRLDTMCTVVTGSPF